MIELIEGADETNAGLHGENLARPLNLLSNPHPLPPCHPMPVFSGQVLSFPMFLRYGIGKADSKIMMSSFRFDTRMNPKTRVLFVCRHNSARSQMAEALIKIEGSDGFEAESASLNPKTILPPAADVMREIGLDISQNQTRSVFDLHRQGLQYDFVITVCDESSSSKCPRFHSPCRHRHWTFPEPSKFEGSHEAVINQTRRVRDQIRSKIVDWLTNLK